MLTVVHDTDEANANDGGGRSLLDEIVRDGAVIATRVAETTIVAP